MLFIYLLPLLIADIDELQLLCQSKEEREVLVVLLMLAFLQSAAFQGICSTFGLIYLLAP